MTGPPAASSAAGPRRRPLERVRGVRTNKNAGAGGAPKKKKKKQQSRPQQLRVAKYMISTLRPHNDEGGYWRTGKRKAETEDETKATPPAPTTSSSGIKTRSGKHHTAAPPFTDRSIIKKQPPRSNNKKRRRGKNGNKKAPAAIKQTPSPQSWSRSLQPHNREGGYWKGQSATKKRKGGGVCTIF